MYARTVSMSIKVGAVEALVALIESEIIPLLWRQEGFQDALTLVAPGGREAIGVSVWSRRADADRYGRSTDKEVMNRLGVLLDGFGTAQTFQMSNSTFHKIGSRKTEAGGR